MRKRDLGILLISAFAVFISLQHEGNFSFREAWYHVPHEAYNPMENEVVDPPAPIGFDLNGDGRKEVIFVTTEAKLQVVEPANPPASQSYQLGRVLKEVSFLPPGVGVGHEHRRPIAMGVGYLDPPPSRVPGAAPKGQQRVHLQKRKAVIAVVTADWSVLCFDHNLKQLWEASIQTHLPPGAVPKEIAVLVTNHTMHRGDRGMVIVGGRTEAQHFTFSDPVEDQMKEEELEEGHRKSAGKGYDLEDIDEGTSGRKTSHFSYYAFEGGKGGLVWKHDSKDFHRDLAALSEQLLPQHNYKLDANAMTARHFGELECREYRASILHAALPHRWDHNADTHFRLASFHRHRRHSHKRQHPKHRTLAGHKDSAHQHAHGGPPARHTAGRDHHNNVVARALGATVDLAKTGKRSKMGPHEHVHGNFSAHHWWAANSVVAHLKEGIEVIHLYSGRTVCKLLMPPGELHADVNGDGVIDHVKVTGAKSGERFVVPLMEGPVTMRPCWAMATSGVPEREELFNGSVCRPEHPGMDLQAALSSDWDENGIGGHEHGGAVEIAVPIHMPRHRRRRRHHRRHHGGHGDVIFLNSRGEITSYATEGLHGKGGKGTHGHMRWQIQTEASWTPKDSTEAQGAEGHPGWANTHGRPTLTPMALRAGGHAEVILAAGETQAVVVSATGHVLTSLHLPTAPQQPIMVMDFNGDHLNDIIIISSIGIYGFIQVRQPGAFFLSSLVGCLIVAICMAFVTLHLSAGPGKPRRGDKRSTD